jgi:TetR/AcrR family acrAB operon transcriptional repressor
MSGGMPVARKTREEALETRRNILEASLDIFSEKNYADVSMTEIAEAVHMTKGAVYWHFRNKSDLLLNLITYLGAKKQREISDVSKAPKKLEGLKRHYITLLNGPKNDERFPKVRRLMLRRHEWPDDVKHSVEDIKVKEFLNEKEMVANLLRDAQANGNVRKDIDPSDTAEVIIAIFYGLGIMCFIGGMLPDNFTNHLGFLFDALEKELGAGDKSKNNKDKKISNDINRKGKGC